VLSVFYAALLTETNQLTLESIAGQFGDDTISTDKAVVAITEHNQHGGWEECCRDG
jgi:predicted secreted protein